MPPKKPPMGPPSSKAAMPVMKGKAKAADLDPVSDFDMELDGDDDEAGSVKTMSSSASLVKKPSPPASDKEDELDYSDVRVEDRFTSGFYAKLDAKFSLLRNAASNIKLHDVYFVESRGIFCYKSSPSTEVQVAFLMQVLLPVGANFRGNKPIGTPINDKTNVRVVIPGGRLSNWNADDLDGSDPFQELIYLSTQLFIKGEGGEEAAEKIMDQAAHDPKLVIKYPVKKSVPELEEPDMTTVVTDMMYKTPPSQSFSLKVSRSPRKRKADEDVVPVARAATTSAAASTSSKPASAAVGDLSDPSIMPGHNESSDVTHVDAKVVQLDIRDVNGHLIPPPLWADSLTAGTLLLVQAKMKKWVVPASSKNTYVRTHIYQWVADSMQILAKGHTQEATTTTPPVNLDDPELVYLEDFNRDAFTFGSPSKKAKTSAM